MPVTQSNRLITVTTPLGADVLLFHRMTGTEALSRLYEYEVEFLSENHSIGLDNILGQNICVNLLMANDQTRNFNGFVSRFSQHGTLGEYHCYRAIVRPWLWFLTRTSNCRIFQEMTVPDIIKQVCNDKGFTDIEDQLTGSYPTWVYCVQYRETDFDFISRLMEQEGIYYFFKHEKDKHTVVLSDSISAHESVGEIPYYPEGNVELRERDHIDDLSLCQQVQTGTYAQNDYDFEKPKASLLVKSTVPRNHAYSDFEQYDYPGEYLVTSEGDNYASCRIQELQSQFEQVDGRGNVRGCRNGGLFKLTNYPREDQNREYLVISTSYQLQSNEYFSADGSLGGEDCRCTFQAIDSKQSFRAQRITPKPVVQGPQTAVVVGPSGDEIYTDEHGRVKVQFHWDREGKKDENSSCWIRVSQVHAGKGFGGIDTPRIDEEVIVDFLEGDPDKPIVTGRVYNGDNKPPNGLPAAAMVSGLKSNSTPGGGGDNTIMLDDTKGKEGINIHGQYNMDTTVDNDQSNTISNNKTTSVGVDHSETVGSNQTIQIGANQTVGIDADQGITVAANKTVSVGADHTESVGSSQSVTIGSNKTENVGIIYALTVGAAMNQAVGAALIQEVGAAKVVEIGGAYMLDVGAVMKESVGVSKSSDIGASLSESIGGAHSEKVSGAYSLKAAQVKIQASKIVLVAGGSKITLDGGGVTIKGSKISLNASGSLSAKAGGSIKIKGSTIAEN